MGVLHRLASHPDDANIRACLTTDSLESIESVRYAIGARSKLGTSLLI
jgi:hypothetical protein